MTTSTSKILFSLCLLTILGANAQSIHSSQQTSKPSLSSLTKEPNTKIFKTQNDDKKTDLTADTKNPPPKIELKNFFKKGGVATGGGNLLEIQKMSLQDLRKLLLASKEIIPYTMKRLEFTSNIDGAFKDSDPALQSLMEKLFKSEKNIYQKIQEAQFQILDTGACYDNDGLAVDASAKDAPTICFSLERISKNLNNDSTADVVALVAHEISHLAETTEVEAFYLQHMVRSGLIKDPAIRIPELVKDFKRKLADAISNSSYSELAIDSLDSNMTCGMVSGMLPAINDLLQTNMKSWSYEGFSYLNHTEVSMMTALLFKQTNALSYCFSSMDSYQKILNLFGDKQQVTIEEFQDFVYEAGGGVNGKPNPLPNGWIVRKVGPKNNKALALELLDINNALKQIQSNL